MPETYAVEFGPSFQQHALAVLLRTPALALRYRSALSPEYFVNERQQQIAEVLLAHVDEYHDLPMQATFLELLRPHVDAGDWPAAEAMVEKLYREDVTDARIVGDKLAGFGANQALALAVVSAAERIERGNRDIRKLIDDALLVGQDLHDLGLNYRSTLQSRLDTYRSGKDPRDPITTGIPHLDAMLMGGLGRREVGVVLAGAKFGKSSCLVNFGYGALVSVGGLNVVHYTMEMSAEYVERRYDDRLMGSRVRHRKSEPERYAAELEDRVRKFTRGNLIVRKYRQDMAKVSTLRSHLSVLTGQGIRPDVVIVDYADLLRPEKSSGEMRFDIASIYYDLSSLAFDFDAAVWTASQAKASALDKPVLTIADFAEAFAKAQIVDVALGFSQTDQEKLSNRCRLFGAAFRYGPSGYTVECDIRRESCRLTSTGLFDPGYQPLEVQGLRVLEPDRRVVDASPAAQTARRVIRDGASENGNGHTRAPSGGSIIGVPPSMRRGGGARRSDKPRREIEL